MKKYFIMAAVAVAATFTFTACSDDDNKGGGSQKPTDLTDLVPNEGSAFFNYTGNPDELLTEELVNTLGGTSSLVPKTVDFGMPDANGDGEGVMELNTNGFSSEAEGKFGPLDEALPPTTTKARLQAKSKYQYVTFQYNYDTTKDAYLIQNFASLKYRTGQGMFVTFQQASEPIVLTGTLTKDNIPNGENTSYNCRAWAIEKINLEVQKNGKQTVGEVFNTTNLYEIAKQVEDKHDVKLSMDDKEKLENLGSLIKLSFATNGRLSFYFSSGKIYTGTWKWKNMGKGEIEYTFDKSNMKNAFIETKGNAKVSYKLDKKTIEVVVNYTNKDTGDKYKISTIFVVKPYVRKMIFK